MPYLSCSACCSCPHEQEIVPEGAFAGVPRLRHVSAKSGIRLIGAEAWQNCGQLRIVKLPATVVGISDNAFRYCKLLNSVSAPGCLCGMLLLAMGVCIGRGCKSVQLRSQALALSLSRMHQPC